MFRAHQRMLNLSLTLRQREVDFNLRNEFSRNFFLEDFICKITLMFQREEEDVGLVWRMKKPFEFKFLSLSLSLFATHVPTQTHIIILCSQWVL